MKKRSSSVDAKKNQMNIKIKHTDHYTILGVSKNSTDNEIKTAYRKLALQYHPDKNSDPLAKEVFKKVADSYSTLIDTDKRAAYDRRNNSSYQTKFSFNASSKQQSNKPKNGAFFQSNPHSRFSRGMSFQSEFTDGNGRNKSPDSDDSYEKYKKECAWRRKEEEQLLRKQGAKTQGSAAPNSPGRKNDDLDFDDLLGKLFEQMNNLRKASRKVNANKSGSPTKVRTDFFRNEPIIPPKRQPVQINMLALIGLFIVIFLAFSAISNRNVVSRPSVNRLSYSLIQNKLFLQKKETPQLKTPYYVRAEYDSIIRNNPLSVKETEQKVDKEFLVRMKANCLNSQQIKQKYYKLADSSKGAMRKMYKEKAEQVNEASCVRIGHLKKKYPDYLTLLQFE